MDRNKQLFSEFYFKDTSFAQLMQSRIFNVMLIASKYDAFMLEDDGRVDEHIFFEYVQLNLRYPPRFIQIDNTQDALRELDSNRYDLVIAMPTHETQDMHELASSIKRHHPQTPFVVLTPFSKKANEDLALDQFSKIDYIFSWLGNTDLLLAIIKLIEDEMNVEQDVSSVGVQTIIVVEDSVRFYSSILPNLYRFILKQSQSFSTEALNEHQRMLRMRGRPKILLARNFEEAMELYQKYQFNTLGIISDICFPKQGILNKHAGIEFCQFVRACDPHLPITLQSTDTTFAREATSLNASFLDKESRKLAIDLRETILRNFGFGSFVFINPDTGEDIVTVRNLKELQDNILEIPDDSLFYHATRNHISRWLYSRAMFPIAEYLRTQVIENIEHAKEIKELIFQTIVQYRKMKNRGVVAEFRRGQFDQYSSFARIGDGSLGGKGRGLAFIDSMIKHNPALEEYKQACVTIPKTLVLCTDLFDEFMDRNNLYQVGLSSLSDEEILHYFLKGKLNRELIQDFLAFFAVVKKPVAIRSSSLLEDSHYQPFAGIYSTYMIPYLNDKYEMLQLVSDAIKAVYASVFYKSSKAYMATTSNVIDQEKMAIIIQEVVGTQYDNRFYPSFSGVARSINYYPIQNESPEEGIADIAIGLGKYIVDGGQTLRFSPAWPHKVLQTSTLDLALRDTQKKIYALDMNSLHTKITTDDSANLQRITVREADKDGSIKWMVSTYDAQDRIIRDGYYPGGRKVVTFANILKNKNFDLARILQDVLKLGAQEMGRPIEIEFAVNLDPKLKDNIFYWLQIRPIVDSKEMQKVDVAQIHPEDSLVYSTMALGHGVFKGIHHIVYVKTKDFQASDNPAIAQEIEQINDYFMEQKAHYVLIGPGRWGSEDIFLGIPIKWSHISQARIIVESALSSYRVEPSQGTHFFQNMTSLGVGYFTLSLKEGDVKEENFDQLPAILETKHVRVVRYEQELDIRMDGKKSIGTIREQNI